MTPEKPVPHLSEVESIEQAADLHASNLYTKSDTKSYSIHKIYKDGFKACAQWQERQSTQMYTAEQTLSEFILEIEWLTTDEFCDKYKYDRPSWKGDVSLAAMEFAYIDAMKWNLIKQKAKEISKSSPPKQ